MMSLDKNMIGEVATALKCNKVKAYFGNLTPGIQFNTPRIFS